MSFKTHTAIIFALFCSLPLFAQQKEQTDSLVRLMSAKSVKLQEIDGQDFRKVFGPARFLHNDTYLLCDTAYWNVSTRVINAFGNVQIIQEETVLNSDKLDYLIDENLAQFRGSVVQLQDKDGNILRTHHLDYNTKDSVALFRNGCAMKDKDGQIIESLDGSYDSKLKTFVFNDNVNMYSDSMFVKSTYMEYKSQENKAYFPRGLDSWRDKSMLSADYGVYDRGTEEFFFRDAVHLMNDKQEGWTDSLYVYRDNGNLEMKGVSQMLDTTRNAIALARHVFYEDSTSCLTLTKDAAVVFINEEKDKIDTVYIGADRLTYRTYMKFAIPIDEIKASEERLNDINTDPVQLYRRKAYEDYMNAQKQEKEKQEEQDKTSKLKRKSREELDAEQRAGSREPKRKRTRRTVLPNKEPQEEISGVEPSGGERQAEPGAGTTLTPEAATVSAGEGYANSSVPEAIPASSSEGQSGKTVLPAETSAPEINEEPADSLARPDSPVAADSLAQASTPVAKDSTKFGFISGLRNVKVWRRDIQMVCDSLLYNELDSLVRLYREPVIWNDNTRQYFADSISMVFKNNALQKASLMSNAFIIIQEDSSYFDQIRGAEVLAYFDSTAALRRLDALGGSTSLFYLRENDALATVNKVECKIFSAGFKDGEIETVRYFDKPQNDAYPVVQMPKSDHELKGFKWMPEKRPQSGQEITDIPLPVSARKHYETRPRTSFEQTEIYFPNYMSGVYKAIADNKLRQPKSPKDSLRISSDIDSTVIKDSSGRELRDSLNVSEAQLSAQRDSLARIDSLARVKARADSLYKASHKPTKEELRRKEKEEKARLKQLAREAEWARLDSLDAVRAAEKAEKKRLRHREKVRKELEALEKEAARENRIRSKWIEIYRRRKEREERRNN